MAINLTTVNLLSLATSFQYAYHLDAIANASVDHISFISYNDSFGMRLSVSTDSKAFANSYVQSVVIHSRRNVSFK